MEPYMENASQLPRARLSRTPSLVRDPFLYTSMANHAAGSHGWYMVFPVVADIPKTQHETRMDKYKTRQF